MHFYQIQKCKTLLHPRDQKNLQNYVKPMEDSFAYKQDHIIYLKNLIWAQPQSGISVFKI